MDPLGPLNPAASEQKNAQQKYWTQQQIDYANQIARQLNQSASDTSPIYSPWAGASRMVDALVGGLTAQRAMQMQRQNMQAAIPPDFSQSGGGASPSVDTGAPSSNASVGGGPVSIDAAKAAIAGNEQDSRGYGTIGPVVQSGAYAGDRAYGKYQVMGRNIQAELGMNPQQFLQSPDVQEKYFEQKFGGLMQRSGNFNDAASMWFSGRPMAQAGNASDGYTTVPKYVAKADASLARQGITASPAQQPNNGAMNFANEASPNFNPLASPQASQNGPAATPQAQTPQSVQQPPVSQGGNLATFIPPVNPQMRDYVANLLRMGNPMGLELSKQMAAMEQITTPDGHHVYQGNPYIGYKLSGLPAKPQLQTLNEEAGGAKTQRFLAPQSDAQGNLQYREVPIIGQNGQPQNRLDALGQQGATIEGYKKAADTEAERENKVYAGYSGEAGIHNQMHPFVQIGLSVLNNSNLWTGPLNEQAQKVKQALVNAGMMAADGSTPMEVFKKTMAQAMVTKLNMLGAQGGEAGEKATRIFLPMVQQMQDSSPTADNSVAGNRYLLNTMNHERDRANLRADSADEWRVSHNGSMLGFDKHLRDLERNDPRFQAQPDELFVGGHAPGAQPPMPNEGDTRKLSSGATAVFRNGQWVKQ